MASAWVTLEASFHGLGSLVPQHLNTRCARNKPWTTLVPGIGQYLFFLAVFWQALLENREFSAQQGTVSLWQLRAPAGKSQLFSTSVVYVRRTLRQLWLGSRNFSVQACYSAMCKVHLSSSSLKVTTLQYILAAPGQLVGPGMAAIELGIGWASAGGIGLGPAHVRFRDLGLRHHVRPDISLLGFCVLCAFHLEQTCPAQAPRIRFQRVLGKGWILHHRQHVLRFTCIQKRLD